MLFKIYCQCVCDFSHNLSYNFKNVIFDDDSLDLHTEYILQLHKVLMKAVTFLIVAPILIN